MATVQDLSALTDPVTDRAFGHIVVDKTTVKDGSAANVDNVVVNTGVAGFVTFVDWEDVEPTKGNYTFSLPINSAGTGNNTIQDYLDELEANTSSLARISAGLPPTKLYLSVVLRHFSWSGGCSSPMSLPLYLRDYMGIVASGASWKNIASISNVSTYLTINLTSHGYTTGSAVYILDLDYFTDLNKHGFTVVYRDANSFYLREKNATTNVLYADYGDPGTITTGRIITGATSAWRFNSYLNSRLIDVYAAIYNQFSSHANFGGFRTSETSLGADIELPTGGYGNSLYVSNLIKEQIGFRSVAPDCEFFQLLNFAGPGTSDPLNANASLDIVRQAMIAT